MVQQLLDSSEERRLLADTWPALSHSELSSAGKLMGAEEDDRIGSPSSLLGQSDLTDSTLLEVANGPLLAHAVTLSSGTNAIPAMSFVSTGDVLQGQSMSASRQDKGDDPAPVATAAASGSRSMYKSKTAKKGSGDFTADVENLLQTSGQHPDQQGTAGAQSVAHQVQATDGRSFQVKLNRNSDISFKKPVIRLTYLIVGEAGLGKTTFQKNLFGLYTGEVELHDGQSTTISDFEKTPEKLCKQITVESSDAVVHYRLQDTPGFGDMNDIGYNIQMIQDHVRRLDLEYLKAADDPSRTRPLSPDDDFRVDLCLFFIPAHRIKQMDLNFMKGISDFGVPVLPIIAKADTMTVEETFRFKAEVRKKAREEELKFFLFSEEEKQAALRLVDESSEGASVVPDYPYAVICSNDLVAGERQEYHPIREYKWGKCYPFDPNHSDFSYLRSLIMHKGVHEIKEMTERRYHEVRKAHYSWGDQLNRKLASLTSWAPGRLLLGVTLLIALIALALGSYPSEGMDSVWCSSHRKALEMAQTKIEELQQARGTI